MPQLTPETLQQWLEWAGARLVALPGARVKPADSKVIWPEYSQDSWQVLEFRKGMKIRAPIPSAEDITLMDEIILLPSLCEWENRRRTVRLRTLMHPVYDRHIYSWQKIADMLKADRKSVASWYGSGLREIARKVPCQQVQRIEIRFTELVTDYVH